MLVGLTEDGVRAYAYETPKIDENGNKITYYCPECGAELVLKQGLKNIHHFAHKEGNELCRMKGGGESLTHDFMKRCIKDIVEQNNNCVVSELEYPLGDRIADYYCVCKNGIASVHKIAIECVYKNRDLKDFCAKNQEYSKMGIHVLWLFDAQKFIKKTTNDKIYWKPHLRTDEIIEQAHKYYGDKIYVLNLDDKQIYGIHLYKVKGKSKHILKRTKSPHSKLISKFKLNKFDSIDEDLRFGHMILKDWWTQKLGLSIKRYDSIPKYLIKEYDKKYEIEINHDKNLWVVEGDFTQEDVDRLSDTLGHYYFKYLPKYYCHSFNRFQEVRVSNMYINSFDKNVKGKPVEYKSSYRFPNYDEKN